MASGFINVSEDLIFAPRWSYYDFVLKNVVEELECLELKSIIRNFYPPEDITDDLEMGWGFIDEKTNNTITRSFDLFKLDKKYIDLFWSAVEAIIQKKSNEEDSKLKDHYLFFFNQLYSLKNLKSEETKLKVVSENRDCYYTKKGSQI